MLSGGHATRLGEITRITNKHLLPVADSPMIYYPLKALEQADIKEVCIVSGKEHAEQFIALLGDGNVCNRSGEQVFSLDLTYRMQARPGGIAEAISLARNFAHGERVVVFLGDNIIEGNIIPYVQKFSHQLRGARILLKAVGEPNAYGVPEFDDQKNIIAIEEKPTMPKSRYAITGIYMFDWQVFEFIDSIKPSTRGELEVTDLLNQYIAHSKLEYDIMEGWWRDAGQSPKELSEISQLIYQTGANKLAL